MTKDGGVSVIKGSGEKHQRKKTIADIGGQVPSNFKFGVIVAVAIIWADFLRSVLNEAFSKINISAPILSSLVIAIIATVIAFLVMLGYRKIYSRIKKIKF